MVKVRNNEIGTDPNSIESSKTNRLGAMDNEEENEALWTPFANGSACLLDEVCATLKTSRKARLSPTIVRPFDCPGIDCDH